MSLRVINEVGNKHGRLKVLSFTRIDNIKREAYWKCVCDCGKEVVVRGNHLRSGSVVSCGCYRIERTIGCQLVNLVGSVFGKWTVIKYEGRDKRGVTVWRCKCICGREKVVEGGSLNLRRSTSCVKCADIERGLSIRGHKHHQWNPNRDEVLRVRKVGNLIRRMAVGLVHNKRFVKSEDILGYSRKQFVDRIESQFNKGMLWSNHGNGLGKWNIDHIKPISAFVREGITDPSIINALSNLRPLWWIENMRKGAKFDFVTGAF